MGDINVRITGFSRLDYNKAKVKKALMLEGRELAKIAKGLVGKRGVSSNGADPGRVTGLLRRAIQAKALPGGFAVSVEPQRKVLQSKRSDRDAAYPWILASGVAGTKLGRRRDYIQIGLGKRSVAASANLLIALESAMVARK